MVFSSVIFLFIFLPWTLVIHYFLNPNYRNIFLLLASLLFYAWGEGLLTLLIISSIFINYLAGLVIDYCKTRDNGWAKTVLGGFIAVNVLVLLYFKYFIFFVANLQVLHMLPQRELEPMHLPIGISFYTFHIISYLIDVYRRDAVSQKNPFNLGLYIFLFPQLVAGPIIRYKDISQKIASRIIIGEDFTKGAIRFIRGLAKKMIIANAAALVADKAFGVSPADLPLSVAWAGIFCYTLQIYFDFSGYSDMAIGLGKMLGFNFPENFNYPYIARSIRDFWQRWHISLSTWFRDYLYIPLGGNKEGNLKAYRNMFIVFFVTGFWHGSSWNFIVWGLFHGCFLALERMGWGKILARCPGILQHTYTLLIVMIAWVFFRADSLEHALHYLKIMFTGSHSSNYMALSYMDTYMMFVLAIGIIFSTNIRKFLENFISDWLNKRNAVVTNTYAVMQYACYLFLFLLCTLELAQNNYNPFIYFRF
jgi:alginate O-acetyltransferase complex protein AlgI